MLTRWSVLKALWMRASLPGDVDGVSEGGGRTAARKPVPTRSTATPTVHPATHFEPFLQYLTASREHVAEHRGAHYRSDLNQFLELGRHPQTGVTLLEQIDLKLLGDFTGVRFTSRSSPPRRLPGSSWRSRSSSCFLVHGASAHREHGRSPDLAEAAASDIHTVITTRGGRSASERSSRTTTILLDQAVFETLYATGCRASPRSRTFEIQDLKLSENPCKCLGKGNEERIVNLGKVARGAY